MNNSKTDEGLADEIFAKITAGIDLERTRVNFSRFPNSIIWFFSDGKYAFHYDFKLNNIFLGSEIWRKIKPLIDQGKMNAILKEMFEKHLHLKDIEPTFFNNLPYPIAEKYFGLVKEGEKTSADEDLKYFEGLKTAMHNATKNNS